MLCKDSMAKHLQPLVDEGPGGRQVRAAGRFLCFTKARAEGKGRTEDLHMGLDSLTARCHQCALQSLWTIFIELGGQKRRMARWGGDREWWDCGKLQTPCCLGEVDFQHQLFSDGKAGMVLPDGLGFSF